MYLIDRSNNNAKEIKGEDMHVPLFRSRLVTGHILCASSRVRVTHLKIVQRMCARSRRVAVGNWEKVVHARRLVPKLERVACGRD